MTPATTRSPKGSTGSIRLKRAGGAGHWRNFEQVEFSTLEWVDWFNNIQLLKPIGNIPPAEARYYAHIEEPAMAA